MLIIAQPKSASTSLAQTLAEIRNTVQVHLVRELKQRSRHPDYSLPHHDMVEYLPEDIEKITQAREIHRRHMPPTKNNKQLMREANAKAVILLRDPEQATQAYTRHRQSIYGGETINYCETPKEYSNKRKQLKRFYEGWKTERNNNNYCFIDYEQVVTKPLATVNKILRHFDLREVTSVELAKQRYTGIGIKQLLKGQ